jgi:hypothetical protein
MPRVGFSPPGSKVWALAALETLIATVFNHLWAPSSCSWMTNARRREACRETHASALMLLYPSIGVLVGWSGLGWTAQMAEDFPHHEALEAANDLGLALSLRRAAADIVDRGLVAPHAHDDHAVKGGVGLPVATAVEPVAGDLAAGGWDRADRIAWRARPRSGFGPGCRRPGPASP